MSSVLNPLLGFSAGALTILSPCVLPLVPVVLGSAAQVSPRGPIALAGGLIATFTAAGMALALLGSVSAFDPDVVRLAGAAVLVLAGLVLLSSRLQGRLALAASPLAQWASSRQSGLERRGLLGQFAIGCLLGLVWSPCVGPTLGAATVLAAQGHDLALAAMTMLAFAIGIAAVLLAVAYLGRAAIGRGRLGLLAAGKAGKVALGAILVGVGAMILTGFDHIVEAIILEHLPPALVD